MRGPRLAGILLAVMLAAILTLLIVEYASGSAVDARWPALIAMLCVAAWVGPGVLIRYRKDGGGALKAIAIWLALAVAVALGYAWFHGGVAAG